MEEDKKLEKRKNTEIVALSIIIVALLGALIYLLFIKKDDKPTESPKPQDNQQVNDNLNNQTKKKFTKLEKIAIGDNKNITINNKNVNIKLVDDNLYINEEKLEGDYSLYDTMYVTDYFIMFPSGTLSGEIYKIYDENGRVIKISNNNNDIKEYTNLKIENGSLTADVPEDAECVDDSSTARDSCFLGTKIEFVYDGYSLTVKEKKEETKVNNQENIDSVVPKAIYKTTDGKFSLKIVDNKKAYLNDKLFVILNMKEDDKYAHYSGDFDGEATQSGYNFLVDKEKGIIIERYLDEVSDLNNITLRFYNPWDGDLSIDINYIKCDAGYFFVNEIDGPGFESGASLATVYTTNWKELGYIDMDNIKSDKNGLYVYKDTDGSYNLSGTPIKYDANGNKIN